MKNRFNNITSKEWLPFQKSWFIHESDTVFYEKNLRFFIKYDDEEFPPNVFFYGSEKQEQIFKEVAEKNKAKVYTADNIEEISNLQYIFFDIRDKLHHNPALENYRKLKQGIIDLLTRLLPKLKHRRFVSVSLSNELHHGQYLPFAWDLSYNIATGLSLKDEKIGCLNNSEKPQFENEVFYMLNFRNDENATKQFSPSGYDLLNTNHTETSAIELTFFPKSWEIIKPKARNKKEILHPAKYPENLIQMFIETFTREKENVFDPMSGTASTQLAALQTGRNGYGTELSSFFAEIANNRLREYLNPTQKSLDFSEKQNPKNVRFKIINKDVRDINKDDFPTIDYIITSPPYWDMLNMKGAENQAKRKQKGLKLNYSDDKRDFGNIADYEEFINDLSNIYFKIIELLKPGGVLTIIVKNIKKKGKNYPFAYDLARILQKELILLPEFFWLQDDINLAPYGYGNTFVSNTFHQYCLNFIKPN